ncbi:hypothetical protein I0C86_04130 [Plantactinospora sp. S1510]|uniref:Uncharacterized protein n=1 Tax=Plantactinospora alkalitolerans TaxID=2789879 RepID=A0ABS0GQ92_9ACTN|nr:hypothetical protein [Plantactinospora alkalitolerans]MBF9128184.1 hypothetical protein [Plantactinospora alkalitolerans]
MPIVLAGVLAGAVLLYVVLAIMVIVRRGAWLQGTRLTVRALRERTVDLAAARSVALHQSNQRLIGPVRRTGVIGPAQMVTVLAVTAGDGGQVQLRLASRDAIQLPPEQLFALAGALSFARCPGAAETVAWLRGMATSASVG